MLKYFANRPGVINKAHSIYSEGIRLEKKFPTFTAAEVADCINSMAGSEIITKSYAASTLRQYGFEEMQPKSGVFIGKGQS